MAKTPDNSVTIYLTNPDLLVKAKKVAAYEDRSINRIIERALKNELEKPEYRYVLDKS